MNTGKLTSKQHTFKLNVLIHTWSRLRCITLVNLDIILTLIGGDLHNTETFR